MWSDFPTLNKGIHQQIDAQLACVDIVGLRLGGQRQNADPVHAAPQRSGRQTALYVRTARRQLFE
jgi:hypothetical protein